MFQAASVGAPIDNRAFVAAVGWCIADGVDLDPTLRMFDRIAFVWLNRVSGPEGVFLVLTVKERGGWPAAIRMTSHLGWSQAWAAAMTAYYGPTGLHDCWRDEHDCPSAEAHATLPNLTSDMADAARRFDNILDWYTRVDRSTRWDEVVELKRRPS